MTAGDQAEQLNDAAEHTNLSAQPLHAMTRISRDCDDSRLGRRCRKHEEENLMDQAIMDFGGPTRSSQRHCTPQPYSNNALNIIVS